VSTLDAVIDTALNDYLLTGQREPRNVLASAPDADDTTVTLTYEVKGAQGGARLSVDYEDTYVVSSDPGPKTATIIRGQFGTTAASHAIGATVWVNPKWSRAQVLRAVNAELDALSGQGLFQMAAIDLTFNAPAAGYDLTGLSPDDVIDIYEVRADAPGPTKGWRPITSYRLIRDASAGDFPSGLGLVLFEAGSPGHTVRVTYKKRFSQVTSADAATDLATSAGIDREAHDLLAIGAAIRLVSGSEVRRSQLNAQPDTRRSEDVPPGAVTQSVTSLVKQWERRLREEKSRLARRYPMLKAVTA
jgi:hypothetical protein